MQSVESVPKQLQKTTIQAEHKKNNMNKEGKMDDKGKNKERWKENIHV